MIARAPGSNSLDPTKVEARSDTREIPLATIDERHPSTNYAGSQDTSSENANIYTRRSPVPPQANHLVLERTQRAREATTNVAPSSSSNIILEIVSNIPENISNPNVFQNRHAASSALTRNRSKYDMHRNLMSTIAIDTGTNRVNKNETTMQSVLNHRQIDNSGGTERSHKQRTDNSRGTERSHTRPQGNKKLTLEWMISSTSKETNFVTPSNPPFTQAKSAAVGGERGGGGNDGVKDNDDGCDSPPTPVPNGKKSKCLFFISKKRKCIFDSDSDDSDDSLDKSEDSEDDSNDSFNNSESLGAAMSSIKSIFDDDSDDDSDKSFNKSEDSDNDSNDRFNKSDSDDDSDDSNNNSNNNSNGVNSDDVDGDNNDDGTSRLTRLNLIKTLAEKFGVSKCQHMATNFKHEAELDDSTIKSEEESSMYHILKGWPIIVAHLRKESKELEKNSETKSKSTIAITTFDMTVNQAISGLNRKSKRSSTLMSLHSA